MQDYFTKLHDLEATYHEGLISNIEYLLAVQRLAAYEIAHETERLKTTIKEAQNNLDLVTS